MKGPGVSSNVLVQILLRLILLSSQNIRFAHGAKIPKPNENVRQLADLTVAIDSSVARNLL